MPVDCCAGNFTPPVAVGVIFGVASVGLVTLPKDVAPKLIAAGLSGLGGTEGPKLCPSGRGVPSELMIALPICGSASDPADVGLKPVFCFGARR